MKKNMVGTLPLDFSGRKYQAPILLEFTPEHKTDLATSRVEYFRV
jgi:hypothetical protein